MNKTTLYMVMRLNKAVRVELESGKEEVVHISGIYGFIPVYETMEEAIANSKDGEFKITEIEVYL